ncbi:MAG: hypothetical protein ACXVII_38140 [Solirubrobacteraceae bacterium]
MGEVRCAVLYEKPHSEVNCEYELQQDDCYDEGTSMSGRSGAVGFGIGERTVWALSTENLSPEGDEVRRWTLRCRSPEKV